MEQYAHSIGFSHTLFMPTSRLDSSAHEDPVFENAKATATSYFFSDLPELAHPSADTIKLFVMETSFLPKRVDRWVKVQHGDLCPTHVRHADPFAPDRRTYVGFKTARFFRKTTGSSLSYWKYSLSGEALYLGTTHFSLPNPRYRPWFHKRKRAFFHIPVKVYYVLALN
ncbi:hypothetical protein [Hymenobacter metallilatus]|uniref:Uncharacterized protein n=1 Tax=Hymenobacter metallilatus TaxID=2493666 RepID=A0A3R9LP73_9BACT|nr:hypothetical protein [Hymenobacter metallilatus]RSK23969.1 hypothetical protein EI290_21515 [Hymenobacter metallilatus]